VTEIILGASSTLGPTFVAESFETENVQSEGADVNTDNEDSLCYGRSTVVSDLDGWGFVLNVRWRK
jgi:hypothetical protein